MIDFLADIGIFASKSIIIAFIFAFTLIFIVVVLKALKSVKGEKSEGKLEVIDLKDKVKDRKSFMQETLEEISITDEKELKRLKKKRKKAQKEEPNAENKKHQEFLKTKSDQGYFCPQNLYVINFSGDVEASYLKRLVKKIDAILDVATEKDEVILNLRSPGGLVNAYGLASAQLARIRDKGIKLTVCVDEVAASGGYLMACVADKIIAAPFAYIGSIGVVASLPNFHRLLDKYDVDYEQITAGKYKRTVTMFGENTDEAREKFKQELEDIHNRFKQVVTNYRPQLQDKIDDVATGEHWLAKDALNLGLVDEIATSDSYIAKRIDETFGCAVKIVWHRKSKKSILLKIKKLLCAQTWVKAIKHELDEAKSVDKLF